MILQALVQLAENEKLIADPDFEFRAVSWIVRLKDDGTVVGIEDNRKNLTEGQTDKKGRPAKPRWVGRNVLIPLFPAGRAGTKPRAAFLVDMAKFVFGRAPQKETSDASLLPYVERFRQLVVECESATGDASVGAVRLMLDRVLAGEAVHALPADAGPSDLFMFRVGAEPEPVHARPAVQAYWKQLRAARPEDANDGERTSCLVTGVPIVGKPVLFPLIKGVPGAGTMGSGLLPFNGPSARTWSSYGLEGNENAPVSRLAAEAAATALNRLVDPRPTNGKGEPLPVRRIRLSDDTIVVFWSPEPEPEVQGVIDLIPDILDPPATTADVGNLFKSPAAGKLKELQAPARFYAMTLTGTTGRVIVRDWLEGTVAEVQRNLRRHFADLDCVRNTPPSKGQPPRPVMALHELLDAIATPGRDSKAPASLAADFVHAALRGTLYPLGLLQRALLRERTEAGGDEWSDAIRRDARAALLKAVLNRRRTTDADAAARYPEVLRHMDPHSTSPGYNLGALLAVMERLQAAALGDINASIIDKYFASASATPRVAFDRLLKNARHHARKAADDEKAAGQAFVCERLMDEIVSRFAPSPSPSPQPAAYPRRLPPRPPGFPPSLPLEEQGLFVIGYHHMRRYLWMNREEREAWEAEHPDAPRAFRRKPADAPANTDAEATAV